MIPRGERLRARNEAALALDNGTFDDPQLAKILGELEPYRELEEAVGDYHDLVIPKNKSQRESGLVKMVAQERTGGLSKAPNTLRAVIAAEQQARSGRQTLPERDISRMAGLLKDLVVPGDINKLGSLGARGNLTGETALLRAAALATDLDNGFDPKTRVPFNVMNQAVSTPLDAGHVIAHASRPDLSDSPENIGFQNAYENRGQASAEKFASQQGREATQTELANALYRSFVNKMIDDVKLPSRNTKEGKAAYAALMDPINAKLAAAGIT